MYTSNTFYALLIGISKYRNPSMPDLPATINDVRALAEVLTDPYYWCYLNENVRALLNEQATSTGIRMALQQVAQTVTIESTVLIYFSGHGGLTNERNDQKVYLCSQETDPDDLEHTAISGVEFDLLLAAIPARKLLIILDACHAGGAAKIRLTNNAALWREGLSDNYMQELAQGSGRVVIASSKEDQLS
jgi:uncharacterized caspase-like protein